MTRFYRTRPAPGYVLSSVARRRAGISQRQFDQWLVHHRDVLGVDVIEEGAGSGYPRWVREADLPKLHVVGVLSRWAMPVSIVVLLTPAERRRLVGRIRKGLRARDSAQEAAA